MNPKRIIMILGYVLLLALILTACGGGDSDKQDARKSYKVGVLLSTSLEYVVSNPLKIELEKLGYVEGDNIDYMIIVAETPERLNTAIDDLMAAHVDVIYAAGSGDTRIVLERTSAIPVVFASGFDETVVRLRELQADGALVTGITFGDVTTKRLDLLLKMDPSIKKVYAPYDPTNELSAAGFALLNEIAPQLGLEIVAAETSDIDATQQAIGGVPDDVDAIFMWTDRFAAETWEQWANLGITRHIPTSIPTANIRIFEFLMGYGPNFDTSGGQSARIIDRILHDVPANEIPIEPSDPSLAINLGVANQIGLYVPDTILDQASIIVHGATSQPAVVLAGGAGAGACNTLANSPMGTMAACFDVPCDALVDSVLITFGNREDVTACAQEGILGMCVTADSTAYFYEGNETLLSSACSINGGTWTARSAPDGAATEDAGAG